MHTLGLLLACMSGGVHRMQAASASSAAGRGCRAPLWGCPRAAAARSYGLKAFPSCFSAAASSLAPLLDDPEPRSLAKPRICCRCDPQRVVVNHYSQKHRVPPSLRLGRRQWRPGEARSSPVLAPVPPAAAQWALTGCHRTLAGCGTLRWAWRWAPASASAVLSSTGAAARSGAPARRSTQVRRDRPPHDTATEQHVHSGRFMSG